MIMATGAGITGWAAEDKVLDWSWDRSSRAEQVAVPASRIIAKPPKLP